MTSSAFKRPRKWRLAWMIRRAIPVPFGWHTRYMVMGYCRHTFLVACAILVIALSIDLTFFLAKLLAVVPPSHTSSTFFLLVRFCILRGTDFLAELLPLICFFGVFWTEIAHTTSRERLTVWLSGRTPNQCLLPALLFGLIVGVSQLVLNYYVRPLAVMTMAEDRLGTYGERFDPRPLPYPQWFAAGDDIVQAMVEPGEPASLRDVKIYCMNPSLSLQTFFRANVAKPISRGKWRLIDGYRWSSPQDASQSNLAAFDVKPPAMEARTPFAEETIDLELSPIWLNTYRVNARYLTHDVFSALGKEHFSPDSEYRTWGQVRWSLPMFCVALSLLATSLSLMLIARGTGFLQLAIIAGAGYFANTLMKLLILLGEHGYVKVAVAGWLMPLITLAVCPLMTLLRRKLPINLRQIPEK